MDRVKGKIAIVTGGASGIGEASAKMLAAEGASVAITDIDDRNGERVVKEIKAAGGSAGFWNVNVTDEKGIEQAWSEIFAKYKALHILVNSAGIAGPPKAAHELTSAEWDKVQNINARGTFLCVKYAVPYMLSSGGGSVVNISSMLGLMGGSDTAYHASKGAVRLMTKADAFDYAPRNIRFNSIHPGYIVTPLFKSLGARNPDGGQKFFSELAARVPQRRLGTPEDVAKGILFLASDDSSYITGIELSIDGGYMIRD